jgi:hypothetical protein
VLNRGAILVIALAATGLVAASIAVWYQHRQTRQALDLWGAATAQRIERAAGVELVALNAGKGANSSVKDGRFDAEAAIDISHAPGVLHFRRSLLQDANFDWDSQNEAAVSESDWEYAVRFSDDEGSAIVLFDLDRGVVANRAAPQRVARITEKMSQGLGRFFSESLDAKGAD